MKNDRLVYSTETGRHCPRCHKPVSNCTCKKKRKKTETQVPSIRDGIIRIRRESKGRKGKTVTIVFGFDLDKGNLKYLAKSLKQHCGTGGSEKDGILVIQGDHRDKIKKFLEWQGHTVKLAGG
jgi:translation initiation factor 1